MARPKTVRGNVDQRGVSFQISPEDEDLLTQAWFTDYKGYIKSWVNGRLQRLHRVVAERLGFDVSNTDLVVDHINKDRRDNRRENIRMVTATGNAINRTMLPKTSGYVGISLVPSRVSPYRAVFRGKRKCFATPEEALAWRAELEKKFWEESQ